MNLTLETLLHGVAATLRDRIAPAIEDSFAIEASRLAAMLITISANAVDDAAAARVWENAALRALFADAQPAFGGDLARRLGEAALSADPGLKISELDRENARLRTILRWKMPTTIKPASLMRASGGCCAKPKSGVHRAVSA